MYGKLWYGLYMTNLLCNKTWGEVNSNQNWLMPPGTGKKPPLLLLA
jgi:hypothetical protein